MKPFSLDCACCTTAVPSDVLLREFEAIRRECPALKIILVPDDIWPFWQQWVQRKDRDDAEFASILLIALENGYLTHITSPVHRYLLEGGKPRKDLRRNYRNDLKEQWMLRNTPLIRAQKCFNSYRGKLTEIMCAEWLEQQGWEILSLAAYGKRGNEPDIEETSPEKAHYAIEVKYVGRKAMDFYAGVEPMHTNYKYDPGHVRLDEVSHTLLCETREADEQLQKCSKDLLRLVLIVVSKEIWPFLANEERVPNNQLWWKRPIPFDHLKEIWIVREENETSFRYSLYWEVDSRSCNNFC
jgi:hypothetical protein